MEDDNPFAEAALDDAPSSPSPSPSPDVNVNKDKGPFTFFEYHKIDHTKRKAKVSKEQSEKLTWIVLEKVHGCNFSFYCNGKTIACSRRNSLLDDNETFFNFQQVRERYRANIFEFYEKLASHLATPLDSIAIFGELFGGFYPHPDVPDLGLCPVQKEIYYSDKVDFYAFDVWVNAAGGEKYWLDYKLASKLFKECGFFYAEPLLEGPLSECLQFNIAINSTIPAKLGLPALPKNLCEGVIVKSVQPLMMKKGQGLARAIYKKKNPNFEEVNPKVESLYDKNKAKRDIAIDTIYENLERYINHNRMMSLRSKIGEIGKDRIEEAAVLLLKDVMADFCLDFAEVWELVPLQHERITTNTKSKVNTFVVEWVEKNSNR